MSSVSIRLTSSLERTFVFGLLILGALTRSHGLLGSNSSATARLSAVLKKLAAEATVLPERGLPPMPPFVRS